ncbi:hypothetical protein EXU57_11195 [Segetibacter sp. 3557_3]|uniref:hypothetical protein n=1 Tax=Segetibacter sp. 3557_3 TaxID=2547429 RepID=UPI0010585E49|nr:hypothetical protein [Segetibacter sp. 3557_3]TDH26059.1 hypothetical protein EXU57_11195 [Segetibacter sp. 3557_3]
MTIEEFTTSLSQPAPPPGLSVYARALWVDARGDWQGAHALVQELNDDQAAWVHAYLHRKEGDTWNADYWYSRAKQKRPDLKLPAEWEQLVVYFLKDNSHSR